MSNQYFTVLLPGKNLGKGVIQSFQIHIQPNLKFNFPLINMTIEKTFYILMV